MTGSQLVSQEVTREFRNEPRLSQYLNIAKARQSLPNALFDDMEVPLHVTKDTVVLFTGDWHLGAPGTNYGQFEEDIHHIAAAKAVLKEQLFVIGMGDFIDGYLPQGTPRNPYQVLQPDEQRKAAMEAFRLIKPSVYIEGDHDLWHSQNLLEYSWLHDWTQREGGYYAQWGFKLKVTGQHLNGTTWKHDDWLIRHRYSGSRSAHPTGPHKKLVSELGPAKVAALAHTHSFPGINRAWSVRRHEEPFFAVQSGTYKKFDEYGKKLADYQGEYGVPALLIKTDGSILPFDDYADALKYVL